MPKNKDAAPVLKILKGEIETKRDYYKRRSDNGIMFGLDIALDAIDKHIKDLEDGTLD